MSEINVFTSVPPSDAEACAVEYLNYARRNGEKLEAVYIVGIYKDEDGERIAESSFDGISLQDLALVSGCVQRDTIEQMLKGSKIVAHLSPDALRKVEETISEAMEKYTEDSEDE